ncbi:MAG TPA: hypothetical protein VHE33_10450 [Acidobacteriaceae bacterium]|nr:hypothetical protein [Acidobacteriaceae bacterium]
MFKRTIFAAAGLAGAATLALSGVAHAGVNYNNVRYTQASATSSVAGYEAYSNHGDLFQFTHLEANLGINSHGLAVLPAVSLSGLGSSESDTTVNVTSQKGAIQGGAGIQLCNSAGYVAQVGLVNVGGGKMDVVAAAALVGDARYNGDKCENGLATGNTLSGAVVLLANVPVTHAVEVGLLYDPKHAYSYGGRHHSAGTATAYAVDDMADSYSNQITIPGVRSGLNFNNASAGVVADNATSTSLNEAVPDPDHASTANRLFTAAHVKVNGNSEVNGTHEVQGAFQNSTAWLVSPVAATSDGTKDGLLFLNPHVFFDDHFDVDAGSTVITPAA